MRLIWISCVRILGFVRQHVVQFDRLQELRRWGDSIRKIREVSFPTFDLCVLFYVEVASK